MSDPSEHQAETVQEIAFVYKGQPIKEIPRNITHLMVDPSVRRIEDRAFKDCQQLRIVTIAPTVEAIGVETFRGCYRLSLVLFQQGGLKTIGDNAFMWCSSLTNVRLPEGLQTIGKSAFHCCTSLTEVELPDGITQISSLTFGYCQKLRTISVPATVEIIAARAFSECVGLLDCLFLSTSNLKRIGPQAFMRCTSLNAIVLPPTLEHIGQMAFTDCTNLLSVVFASSTAMGESNTTNMVVQENSFANTHSLVNVSIPTFVSGCKFPQIPNDKMHFLKDRFANHPIHRLCYYSSVATTSSSTGREQLMRFFNDSSSFDRLEESSLKDAFQMTPFHILATSASPSTEILDCLLDHYPVFVLACKDCYNNTMMDYLQKHMSLRVVPMLQRVWRLLFVDRVSLWHSPWGTSLSTRLRESMPVHNNDNHEQWHHVSMDFFDQVRDYIQMEITSLMELAAWKAKMRSILLEKEEVKDSNHDDDDDNTTIAHDRRESCRYQSGAGIVMENVLGYLSIGTSFPLTFLYHAHQ